MTMMNGCSEPNSSAHNPYVGPRPIQQGEPLYGRREEVHALFCELQARRIVVLHSPSGAGKSSLVQAGLIPRLLEEKFDVWRPIRVNLDPTGLDGVPEETNRYLLSSMLSLEEELPEDKRRSPADLAGMDFGEYLATRPRRRAHQGQPVVLLFDQFEEVLTVAPRAVEAKREFFTALGHALTDEHYWALFIIREDYLAAFSDYRDRLPTRMANTLRLDLLGLDGAREAALELALAGGREFPAVDHLVRDLSKVQVQQADGSFVAELGLYVEPVQLQVVCRRLWSAMPEDARSIEDEDITEYAGISESLAGYYAQAVDEAARGDVQVERAVREWVGSELIVGGIRSQVRQGVERSGGLDNALIDKLRDSYLVRTEHRAGINWFELSHDRLVEPVQQDNERWEQEHLHPLQVQAKLWENGRRDRALLLGADALADAVAWAEYNADDLTEADWEFLAQSEAREAEERRKRQALQTFAMAISAVALLAISLGVFAWIKQLEADEQALHSRRQTYYARLEKHAADVSAERAELAQQQAWMAEWEGRMALLDASYRKDEADRARANAEVLTLEAQHAEKEAKKSTRLARKSEKQAKAADAKTQIALGEANTATVIAGIRELFALNKSSSAALVLAEMKNPQATPRWIDLAYAALQEPHILVTIHHDAEVNSAEWSSDGSRIATTSEHGVTQLWDLEGKPIKGPSTIPERPNRATGGNFIVWSPDRSRAITVSDEIAHITDRTGKPVATLNDDTSSVIGAAWSPDGRYATTTSWGSTTSLWDREGNFIVLLEGADPEGYGDVAWNSDSNRIVTVLGTTAHLWDIEDIESNEPKEGYVIAEYSEGPIAEEPEEQRGKFVITHRGLSAHRERITSVAWAPDDSRILTASSDHTIRIWDSWGDHAIVLKGHNDWIKTATWSADGSRILTASADKTARVWTLGQKIFTDLRGDSDCVSSSAWSNKASRIVTSDSGGISVWTPAGDAIAQVDDAHSDSVRSIVWSPKGSRFITASYDNSIRLWDRNGKPLKKILDKKPSEQLEKHGYPHASAVWGAWSPNGARFVTNSYDSITRLWDLDGKSLKQLEEHGEHVNPAVWSPDSSRFITTSDDSTAHLWDLEGTRLKLLKKHSAPVTSVAWNPHDGSRVITNADDGSAHLWDQHGRHVKRLEKHRDNNSVGLSAWKLDGSRFITTSDRVIHLWDSEGKQIEEIEESNGTIHSASWSPDGSGFLTASNSQIQIWDHQGGGVRLLEGHGDEITSAAWSPNSIFILTNSVDNVVRIWSRQGKMLAVFKGDKPSNYHGVKPAAFWIHGGSHIVTTLDAYTVRVRPVSIQGLVKILSKTTFDCLTPEDRQTYLLENKKNALEAYKECETPRSTEIVGSD